MLVMIVGGWLACSRYASQVTLKSNYDQVSVIEGRIMRGASNEPFSGRLVATGAEIASLARAILKDTPIESLADAELGGLILVLPVEQGVANGRAAVHVDLRSPKLGKDLVERDDRLALAAARAAGLTSIKIGEATLVNGKLHGPAVMSSPKSGKLAEARFEGNLLDGLAVEYFPGTGQARRELRFERGVRSGVQRSFYPNGTVMREATYVQGAPHGEVLEWYANGAKRARSTYERGAPVGTEQAWFPTGQLQREVVFEGGNVASSREWYSNGKPKTGGAPPDGLIVEYHANGEVHSRIHYVAGVKHGAFELFYDTGKKWETGEFQHGKRHGAHHKWWKNGKLALDSTWTAGALTGGYTRWYADGTTWESATYEAGKRHHRYRTWWRNGAIAHDYVYEHGKLHGDYRTFYDTGAKWAVGAYDRGKPQGTMRRWFPDGRLGYIMHHESGRPHGAYQRWYADGTPRLVATYVRGQLDGKLENWLEDGTVYEIATYEHGRKLATTRKPAVTQSTP